MTTTIYSDMDFLEHHGIKGMKWGVRRYQNYDGTRIKRMSTSDLKSANKRSEAEIKYAKNEKEPAKEIARNTRDAASSARNTTRSIQSLREHSKRAQREKEAREAATREKLKSMSDDDLRIAITRMRMEREYASLTTKETRSGWDTTRDILDVVGGVASIALAGAGVMGVIPLLHDDISTDSELVDETDSLSHHGVKGMKWGVRHEQQKANKKRMKAAKKEYKEAKKQFNKDFKKSYRSSTYFHITEKGRRKQEKLSAQSAVSMGKMNIAKGKYMQAKGIYKGNNAQVQKGKMWADRASNSTKYYKTILKDVNSGYKLRDARSRHASEYESAVKREQDIEARYRRYKESGK